MMAPKEVNMTQQERKCCICGKQFSGYGHNPQPLKSKGECCNSCNNIVVMIRLELSVKDKKVLR